MNTRIVVTWNKKQFEIEQDKLKEKEQGSETCSFAHSEIL